MHETPLPPPATPVPSSQDADHLRLLAIFHYVWAGIGFLIACLPIFHFGLGALMASGHLEPGEPGIAAAGCAFMAFSGLMIVAGWAYAALLVLAGRSLAERRRYTLCLVMAAVSCLFAPIGTALGVFTIIVLMRPSVKAMFGVAESAAPPAPAA